MGTAETGVLDTLCAPSPRLRVSALALCYENLRALMYE